MTKIVIEGFAIDLPNKTFIPQFNLSIYNGSNIENINYAGIKEDICSSEEEALEHAKVHALREIKEKYGTDVEYEYRYN